MMCAMLVEHLKPSSPLQQPQHGWCNRVDAAQAVTSEAAALWADAADAADAGAAAAKLLRAARAAQS